MSRYLIAVLLGAAVGGLMGARRSCETGACPLTSNPYVGALYGAAMGFLLISTISGSTPLTNAKENSEMVTTKNSHILEANSDTEFDQQVLKSPVPTLVDLWAPWCGPCRAQLPVVERVAAQAGERARVVKVNVDEAGDVAQRLGVSSIPTLVVFKDGQEVKRFVGVQSESTLVQALGL